MTTEIHPKGYYRLNQLIGKNTDSPPLIPVSASSIWNYVKAGRLAKPIKLSPGVTVWRASDIEVFLANNGGYNENQEK